MDEATTILKARELLHRVRIDSIPVDVKRIAAACGFEVRFSDKLGPNQSGQTFIHADRKVVVVNLRDRIERQRFTILHEIAHHELELPSVHGTTVSAQQLECYVGRPREEVLCDVFAAECLVPLKVMVEQIDAATFTISGIRSLAEAFQASLSCVASRYAHASTELHIFVLEEKGSIRNVISSATVRDAKFWISNGIRLPAGSAAALARRSGSAEGSCDSEGADWSSSDCATSYFCYEEALVMREWDQSITLITLEKSKRRNENNRPEAQAEDELLPELTGEMQWPGRKRRK
jgi:Zn-dependent peptidase ImmA (M78 family)